MLAALAKTGWTGDANVIDATYVRVHRSVQGEKGEAKRKASVPRAAVRPPRSTRSSTSWAAWRSSF